MSLDIIGIAGSLGAPSKTLALVDHAARLAAARFGGQAHSLDLARLQPSLGQAATLADLAPPARDLVDRIVAADALVVGSPVYKGGYSGLFKHLFDLIDPVALAGKPVLLTATGGGEKHALVIEHQLRPLFGFFEAVTLPVGVYASAADFTGGRPASDAVLARLDRAVDQFGPWLCPAPRSADAA